VDLLHENACSHCRAPIAILDTGAVEQALREWTEKAEAREERRAGHAAMVADGMPQLADRALARGPDNEVDLIDGGIAAIAAVLKGMGFRF
jgi:hypothetical protein